MNQLTNRSQFHLSAIPPAPISREVDISISVAMNAAENGKVPARAALSPLRREQLEACKRDYRQFLKPALPSEIKLPLQALFEAFPQRAEGDEAEDVRLALYVSALAEFPVWAVNRAVKSYRTGLVGDGKWCPTQPQLAKLCREFVTPYVVSLARVEKVLALEVEQAPNSSERQRILEGFRQLQSEIGAPEARAGHRTEEQERKAAAEARLEELAARGSENAISLSDGLRAKMGIDYAKT